MAQSILLFINGLLPADCLLNHSQEEEIFPDKEPWLLMKRTPIAIIMKVHPLHPLIKWAEGDHLRTFAVECAFANVPQALHKAPKVSQVAEQLNNDFIRWKEVKDGKNTDDD